MSDGGIWDRYWQFDRIASCFDGAGATNYEPCIADGWRAFFAGLPDKARILDLCTGNGAAALLAAEDGRAAEIVAVDKAAIDPPAFVTRHAALYAAIAFRGGIPVEALPLPTGHFGAVISQYGVEYSDLSRSLPEAVRVLAAGGRIRFVVHAADGIVAAGAGAVIADADLLLDGIDLTGCAARCFADVLAVERDGGDSGRADGSFTAFQAALERTARSIAGAHDKNMFRNSGAVLLDTFKRRGSFDLGQLLAKAEEVRREIAAHRGRLVALVEAALDARGAEAMAERLSAMGGVAASRPLANADGLIAHVVAARFP